MGGYAYDAVDGNTAQCSRMFITTINRMAGIKLGVKCFHNTWKNPPPIHFEAIIYSLPPSVRMRWAGICLPWSGMGAGYRCLSEGGQP